MVRHPQKAQRRTAFITGAAQGLGASIARALHEAGHNTVLCDIDGEKAAAVATSLASRRALSIRADVRDAGSVRAAMAEAEARFRTVDIVVNNAALTRARNFFDISLAEWDDVMAVNLRSILLTSQAAGAGMAERGWGRIINLASVAGQRGGPQVQGAHYAASKAAVIGLTRYLAHLLADRGVTVNTVAPGPIASEQTALLPEERLAAIRSQIPLQRMGTPEEVAALVVFLASEDAGYVTGATLDINGGLLMR